MYCYYISFRPCTVQTMQKDLIPIIFYSSIEDEGTRTFFYMVDQNFGNDSLEPFESIFIGSTGLAMTFYGSNSLVDERVPGHFSIWWINILATIR